MNDEKKNFYNVIYNAYRNPSEDIRKQARKEYRRIINSGKLTKNSRGRNYA